MKRLALLIVLLLSVSGCATTMSAKITAYGMWSVTPYGLVGIGWLNYERQAAPADEK